LIGEITWGLSTLSNQFELALSWPRANLLVLAGGEFRQGFSTPRRSWCPERRGSFFSTSIFRRSANSGGTKKLGEIRLVIPLEFSFPFGFAEVIRRRHDKADNNGRREKSEHKFGKTFPDNAGADDLLFPLRRPFPRT